MKWYLITIQLLIRKDFTLEESVKERDRKSGGKRKGEKGRVRERQREEKNKL